MKLFSSGATRQMDAYSIGELGIPSTLLMERAAEGLLIAAGELLGETAGSRAAVFCAPGNNGGDGIAAARMLISHGAEVRVFLCGKRDKMTPDSREMERRLLETGGCVEAFDPDSAEIIEFCTSSDLAIDALFGTGLSSPLRPEALRAVALINSLPCPVLSADMPSGIDADSGLVMGAAVYADVTVTFSAKKPGLCVDKGAVCAGRVIVHDIGIPAEVMDMQPCCTFSIEKPDVDAIIPHRGRDTHKGDYGRVLQLCGSAGYTGASMMAAEAAVRSGAGLVFLGVPSAIYPIVAPTLREPIVFQLSDNGGKLGLDAWDEIALRLGACDVCLVGCGLGRSPEITELVGRLVTASRVPLIIDADGITALSENIDILDEASCPVILTPHDGEFFRLGGTFGAGGRADAARGFAARHGCTLVLKGYRTVCAFPDGEVYVNTSGNPGMATGGSGDVLSGLMSSLIGQLGDVKRAVIAGVWLHGHAGDICAERFGEYGMTPTDIIRMLPLVLKEY